ncbi:hypothetical protein H8B06_16720 [Sphingobacterium sp. DN00404]|uniref:Epimerase n=1 Tax=Sphingobacterium micropteri TaxID=2763501 RepID=A0ABR7YT01_9SPHI|nr:hypothetical protein [Sphingobacterium micropteri]MBD1434474.1 hypothetical protein [Sphingobacterium micropteri]
MKEICSKLNNLHIGIVGCGWLGIRMARKWQIKNDLYTTTTSPDKIGALTSQGLNPTLIDFNTDNSTVDILAWEVVSSLDVLIITFPISSRKDKDRNNIKRRIHNLSKFIGNFDGQLFFMDSTSVYPDEQKEFIEDDISIENVVAEYLLRAAYPEVNILRLGGLMGDDRQLHKYNVSNLDAPVNHVHFEDIIAIIEKMIENRSRSKIYNIVAPVHPTKREVICEQTGRPYKENKREIGRLISSKRLMEELDYQFIYPDPRYFILS